MAQSTDRERGIYEDPKGPSNRTIRSVDQGGRRYREEVGRQRVILFDDLARDYLAYNKAHKRSVKRDVASMRRLLRAFGGKPATRVSRSDIEALKVGCTTQGLAPATINRY